MAMEMPFNINSMGDFLNMFQQMMGGVRGSVREVGQGGETNYEEKIRRQMMNQGADQQVFANVMQMLSPMMGSLGQMALLDKQAQLQKDMTRFNAGFFGGGGSVTDTAGGVHQRRFNPMSSGGSPFQMDPNFGSFGSTWGAEPVSRQSDALKDMWSYQASQFGKMQNQGPYGVADKNSAGSYMDSVFGMFPGMKEFWGSMSPYVQNRR